jgi:hypothetical protein
MKQCMSRTAWGLIQISGPRHREPRVTHALADRCMWPPSPTGFMMLAEIAMRQALAHDESQPPPARK